MNKTIPISDSPQVIAPPPFIYLGGLAVGIILHWLAPMPFLPENFALLTGVALTIISSILVFMAFRALAHAKTNIDVRKPTTSIVATGLYRFTRNPIYFSMTLFILGIAVLLNTLWIPITLVPVLLVIQFGVIAREESYLTKKFGEKYLQYKARVRQWI